MPRASTPKSEDIMAANDIPSAIAAVTKRVPSLIKEEENKFAKYSYVSIDAYYEAVAKLMAEVGLVLVTREVSCDVIEVLATSEKRGRDGEKAQLRAFARTTYECDAYLGTQHVKALSRITVMHGITGPQTAGSSASYAEKVFFRVIFKVVTGEPDGDAQETVHAEPYRGTNDGFPGPSNTPQQNSRQEARREERGDPMMGGDSQEEAGSGDREEYQDDRSDDRGPEPEAPENETDRRLREAVERARPEIDKVVRGVYPLFKRDANDWSIVREVFKVFSPTLDRKNLQDFWTDNGDVLAAMKEDAPDIYDETTAIVTARVKQIKAAEEGR